MRINKLSWRTKLFSLFSLVLVASLLLQVLYVIPFIQNRELENAELNKMNEASVFAREAQMGLNQLENLLLNIAEQSIFRNMDIDNQTEVMSQYVNISPEVGSLSVINSTGWFVSGTVANFELYYTGRSYANRPYFVVPFEQGQIYYGIPWWFESTPDIVGCSIAVPINLDTGETIGVLMGSLHLNSLIENVASYPFEEDTVAYLVSPNGMVIGHSEIDLFALEEGPRSLNFSSDYMTQEIMTENANTHVCSHIYDRNGTLYYGHAILLAGCNWGAIVITPLSKIMAPTVMLVNNLWLYNFMLFSAAFIVTFFFAQQITKQQKQNEDQLVRSESLAVLGRLSGGIGHELRNPLGAIKTGVFFLRMALEHPDQDVSETLDILEEEVSTSERIIKSLLDFARPKPPTRQKVQVNEVINDSMSRIQVLDGIEVVYQLEPELPSILADPIQIDQIATNLGINAVQAMPDGGQLIITTQLVDSDWIAMAFTDTGVGIPEEHLHTLYEPLFTTKAKGIGLGLAIIKMIVEAHDGSIEVQSEVGKGTTFIVKLPISLMEEK